jgi:hypothetical protein
MKGQCSDFAEKCYDLQVLLGGGAKYAFILIPVMQTSTTPRFAPATPSRRDAMLCIIRYRP